MKRTFNENQFKQHDIAITQKKEQQKDKRNDGKKDITEPANFKQEEPAIGHNTIDRDTANLSTNL